MGADNYFSMIPEWVLDADVSAKAVRLYCVLQRYANSHGVCFPSRTTLAERCKCSIRTVDQAIDELQGIGALLVAKSRSERGDWANNSYTVVTVDPHGVVQKTALPSAENDTTGSAENATTGSAGNDLLTKAIDNQSHTNHMATAKAIAQGWWEAQEQKPLQSFIALVKVVERAVKAGYETERIEGALAGMKMVPTVAQLEASLKGIRFGKQATGQTAQEIAARKHLDAALAKINRERGTE